MVAAATRPLYAKTTRAKDKIPVAIPTVCRAGSDDLQCQLMSADGAVVDFTRQSFDFSLQTQLLVTQCYTKSLRFDPKLSFKINLINC